MKLEQVAPPEAFNWLDELVKKVNSIFGDTFIWTFVERKVLRGAPKHGDCICCTFRMTLPNGQKMQRLPSSEGKNLAALVKTVAEAEAAEPDLIQTVIEGHHDYCDWGFATDGHAECWVYLELPK